MTSETPPVDQERVGRLMRALLVQNALHHKSDEPFDGLDPFSAAILRDLGLVTVSEHARPDWVRVLGTPQDGDKPRGPLLFATGEGGRGVVYLPAEHLADPDSEIRLAALRYFEQLPAGTLSNRSRKRLEEARPQVASAAREQWLPTARALYESLRRDYYLSLAGFHQSYLRGYDRGVSDHLPVVLRPDAALLSSVHLAVWQPVEEYGLLVKAVEGIATSASLRDALDLYYRAYGHLPLTGSVGLGHVVRLWADAHPGVEVWTELWGWADGSTSPLPRYHACAALLANEQLVPSGAERTLWSEVARIALAAADAASPSQWAESWALRETLAHHYCNYLECLTPGLPGDRLMNMAWWLTERFSELLPQSPRLLRKIRKTTVGKELSFSSFMSHVTHPQVGPSGLRYLTKFTQRTWATAILGELGRATWLVEKLRPSEQERVWLEDGLIRALTQGYPRAVGERDQPVYGFELPLDRLVRCWTQAAVETELEKREAMTELVKHSAMLSADEALAEFVDLLAESTHEGLWRVAHALRRRAYTEPAATGALWEHLTKEERWKAILCTANDDVLSLHFEVLTELAVQIGDPWRLSVPHMFATAAESSDTQERKELLFGFTLFASIHTGTLSAVHHLMRGSLKAEFSLFASHWLNELRPGVRAFTPWSAGRVRAALPSLTLDDPAAVDAF